MSFCVFFLMSTDRTACAVLGGLRNPNVGTGKRGWEKSVCVCVLGVCETERILFGGGGLFAFFFFFRVRCSLIASGISWESNNGIEWRGMGEEKCCWWCV